MAIENLSITDTVTSSTRFAVSINGLDQAVTLSDLMTYINANISTTGDFVLQYSSPSATAFSVNISDNSNNTWLILTPNAGYANGTIVMPALANCVEGQEVMIVCTQAITNIVFTGNGSTVTGAPSALTANTHLKFKFEPISDVWYRVD